MNEKKYGVIDIETIPDENLSEDQKPKFDPSEVKFGNTKDEAKRQIIIEKAEEKFNTGLTKSMSLNNNHARIVSLGCIIADETGAELSKHVFYGKDNDREILSNFKNLILENPEMSLVGWNSKRFDIPMIWKRSVLNKINIWDYSKLNTLIAKYKNDESIDLMPIWNFPNEFGKLSECSKSLGIDAKTGLDGSMIYQAWLDGREDDIKSYNLEDCLATLEILKRVYL